MSIPTYPNVAPRDGLASSYLPPSTRSLSGDFSEDRSLLLPVVGPRRSAKPPRSAEWCGACPARKAIQSLSRSLSALDSPRWCKAPLDPGHRTTRVLRRRLVDHGSWHQETHRAPATLVSDGGRPVGGSRWVPTGHGLPRSPDGSSLPIRIRTSEPTRTMAVRGRSPAVHKGGRGPEPNPLFRFGCGCLLTKSLVRTRTSEDSYERL